MKIIFSRKGFDSRYGGVPSPIILGRPHSLPIPTNGPSATRFGDLSSEACQLVEHLTGGRHSADSYCHLDPDIDRNHLVRDINWRGAFGQGGAAAGHLINQGVRRGDLFLFFGLFQELSPGQPRRYAGPRHHRIYGWLQIGDVLGLDGDGSRVLQRYPWLRNHPHARPGWDGFANHTIYVASEKLHIDGMPTEIPGSGVFANGIVLTAPGKPASIWQVPNWLHPGKGGTGLTYHPAGRWLPDGLVQSAYPGQEFVADGENRVDVRDWLAETMEEQANG